MQRVFNVKSRIARTGRQMWSVAMWINFNGAGVEVRMGEFSWPRLRKAESAKLELLINSIEDPSERVSAVADLVNYNGKLLRYSKDILFDWALSQRRRSINRFAQYQRTRYCKSHFGGKTVLVNGIWVAADAYIVRRTYELSRSRMAALCNEDE